MKKKSIVALALCVLLALPSMAGAVEIVPRQKAIQTALQAVGGVLVDYSIEGGRVASYEMEIISKSGTEYDVRVGMVGGKILRQKADGRASNASSYLNVKTSYAAAMTTAQQSVPGSRVADFELDRERSAMVYQIEVLDLAGIEHSIRINANTGSIISSRKKPINGTAAITLAAAEDIAAKHVGGGALLTELDDERVLHYDVYVVSEAGALYEVEIDAQTGAVRRSEMDD